MYSLSADPTSRIYSRGNTLKVSPKRPAPCWMSVADIRCQIAAELLEIAQWSQGERIGNQHRYFQWYDRWPSTTSPSHKMGSKMYFAWYVEFGISNRHIFPMGDPNPIHFMFGFSMVFTFQGQRIKWRYFRFCAVRAAILEKKYGGIARFHCDSTAFLWMIELIFLVNNIG